MFYLGIFRMPKKVAQKIISLQTSFFWGANDRGRTFPSVKWDVIQRPKTMGGLGVGDIVIRNATMLFKW